MNSIMERWVQTCRRELLDRTLIWDRAHLLHAVREFELFYNGDRPRSGPHGAAPLCPRSSPITDPGGLDNLGIPRRDRRASILHEYVHAV